MARLTFARPSKYRGRFRRQSIVVDGEIVGKLGVWNPLQITATAGEHVVDARLGRFSGNQLRVALHENGELTVLIDTAPVPLPHGAPENSLLILAPADAARPDVVRADPRMNRVHILYAVALILLIAGIALRFRNNNVSFTLDSLGVVLVIGTFSYRFTRRR